jgi:hypothetical protein
VLCHKRETHLFEQCLERARLGMGEFHEFKTIGASGVFGADFGWRRIVRKRAHFFLSFLKKAIDSSKTARDVCIVNEFSTHARTLSIKAYALIGDADYLLKVAA